MRLVDCIGFGRTWQGFLLYLYGRLWRPAFRALPEKWLVARIWEPEGLRGRIAMFVVCQYGWARNQAWQSKEELADSAASGEAE